jgi:hypothetical protein
MFSLGLPGFCTFLYVVRVLQAMQRTRTAFYLYLVENGLNVAFAAALVGPLGVRGLALSVSIAYTAAAAWGITVLRRWLGTIGGPGAWAPLRRAAGATIVMGAVVLVVSDLSGSQRGAGLLLRVAAAVAAGFAAYAGVGALLGGRRRPFSFLTGEPTGTAGAAAPSFDKADVGSGAGLGVAWGDTRTPVNTGPRIRIVPPPGTPDTSSPAARQPEGAPRAARVPRASKPPAPRADVTLARFAPERAGGDESDNDDDPGARRWVGGTKTSLRGRLPR